MKKKNFIVRVWNWFIDTVTLRRLKAKAYMEGSCDGVKLYIDEQAWIKDGEYVTEIELAEYAETKTRHRKMQLIANREER